MNEQDWLKTQLDKIEEKIDKLDNRIDNVDITLAKQAVVLEDHTRRSTSNEEHVELLKTKMELDLKPLQSHVAAFHLILKLIGVVVSCITVISGFIRIMEYFGK